METITDRLAEVQARAGKVKQHLSTAQFILREAYGALQSCLGAYYYNEFSDVVFFGQDGGELEAAARGWLLMGRNYLQAIDADDSSPENVNRSLRAVRIMEMMQAQVNAYTARLIVAGLRKNSKGFKHFEVLAHQALSYAEAVQADNWDVLAAPVMSHPHELLIPASGGTVVMFRKYGMAAVSYAHCLEAQLHCLSGDERPTTEGFWARLPKQYPTGCGPERLSERDFVTPWDGDFCRWTREGDVAKGILVTAAEFDKLHAPAGWTQEQVRSYYVGCAGDDKRETAHYCGSPKRIYPKRRLVGFDRVRGVNSRKRRAAAQTAAKS